MASTEIISTNQALEQLNAKLKLLEDRAKSIAVTDQSTFVRAAEVKLDLQSYMKAVKLQTDGEIEIKKEELRRLQNQQKMLLAPAETMADALESKRRVWANEERRKAEEEQRRINEEARIAAAKQAEEERKERDRQAEIARKAREKEIEAQRKSGELKAREAERLKKEAAAEAEREKQRAAQDAKDMVFNMPQVSVKAAIPSVAGLRNAQYWKYRVVDESKLKREYLQTDAVKIGQMVRNAKDKAKAEAECPESKFGANSHESKSSQQQLEQSHRGRS